MRWKPLLISSTLSLSLLLGPAGAVSAESDQHADTLLELYQLLVGSHYTHPDADKVLQGAIKGMLDVVDDPFTSYMTPEEYAAFTRALDNQYAGIGTALQAAKSGEVLITEVYAGSPAEKAGLQAGDRIVAVDGVAATGKTAAEVASMARGKAGTETMVMIARGSEAPRQVKVVREAISLPTVTSKDLGNGVGYLRILTFGGNTSKEFFDAYGQLEATSPNGIVLDLRGNGGGSVLSALEIADHFLTEGTLLIMHDEEGGQQVIGADELGTEEMPLAVLVDQQTASASEMLAGALQVNARAALIGAQTFGKGTMQEPVTLPNGGVLKVSVDAWELGDGTSIQKIGLTPDIRLTSPSVMVNAGIQHLLPNRVQTLTLQKQGGVGNLNGIQLLDVPKLLTERGRDYLPLRYVAEAFGSEVNWVAKTNSVEFKLESQAVRVVLNSGNVYLDKRDTGLKGQVLVRNGVSYLSVDALKKVLNGGVSATSAAITITAD
ncbi:carboxyl-terminal processing protease [Tumebacillus sp. BK434]|uniref:S41 family peptidase n=1 Tax=Tumebacillus sp. BK434 TaxID=2512169 RepID=UPI00104CB684|nr:S41 family peptidase [Tumebacillus sp. BK434]TCP57790.1 carboxyl-terminal processing protease [Tumebacillus sp. BK434]